MADRPNPDETEAAHTTYRFFHQGLMGTMIDIRIDAVDELIAEAIDRAATKRITQLEQVFSVYDNQSELARWRRGEVDLASPEFTTVMVAALRWQTESHGRFNPLVGEQTRIWTEAQSTGQTPSRNHLQAVAESIAEPRFALVDGTPQPVGDCTSFTLNAIAKGFIVDQAIDSAMRSGAQSVSINAGGDLAHRGQGSARAGIENPHRPYDNEPPLAVIDIAKSALATSGHARRGFKIDGRWFGHVIDPRSGWPVENIASISVVAADAMTADVVATVAGVMEPDDAIAYLDQRPDTEGMVVDAHGGQSLSRGWSALTVS